MTGSFFMEMQISEDFHTSPFVYSYVQQLSVAWPPKPESLACAMLLSVGQFHGAESSLPSFGKCSNTRRLAFRGYHPRKQKF